MELVGFSFEVILMVKQLMMSLATQCPCLVMDKDLPLEHPVMMLMDQGQVM